VAAADTPFPDMSVNRFSINPDLRSVLMGSYAKAGVFSCQVSDVPTGYTAGGKHYTFHVVEDPKPRNAAHAEVRTYTDGVYDKAVEPPKSVRRSFRIDLASVLKVEIAPP